MRTPKSENERLLLPHTECRYRSEDLFFQIIHSHFSNIELRTQIQLHEGTITPIRHYILELERMNEKAFYDYALWRIHEEFEFLVEYYKNLGTPIKGCPNLPAPPPFKFDI